MQIKHSLSIRKLTRCKSYFLAETCRNKARGTETNI